jgi:hypothetical protein
MKDTVKYPIIPASFCIYGIQEIFEFTTLRIQLSRLGVWGCSMEEGMGMGIVNTSDFV